MLIPSNPLHNSPTFHPNESAYTLATVQHGHESDESSSLLSTSSHHSSTSITYGTTPIHPPHRTRRVIFNATLKMAIIFVVSCIFLGGTLWVALPTLDPYVKLPFYSPSPFFYISPIREDRPLLHIPKSFSDLQNLNYLLKKYRDIYPFRVFVSYVVTYLLWVVPSRPVLS